MDIAELSIESGIDASLFIISEICYKCSLRHALDIEPDKNVSLKVSSRYVSHLEVRSTASNSSSVILCRLRHKFHENYRYLLRVDRDSTNQTCRLQTLQTAYDVNIPIYVAMLSIGLICVFFSLYRLVKRRCSKRSDGNLNLLNTHVLTNSDNVTLVTTVKSTRLKSLDCFRGFCLCVMIFVNYGGGGYKIFQHSVWNGLTIADTVFPWFTFIMGTSLALSLNSMMSRAVPKRKIAAKVTRRAVTLFLLGMMISNMGGGFSGATPLSSLRILGVLQRLAIVYLVVALLHLSFLHITSQTLSSHMLKDITPYWMEWLIVGVLLIVHCLVTFLVKFADCPRGYLGAGGDQDGGANFNCTGGAAGYLDRLILGEAHVYQSVTSSKVYNSIIAMDPEGILGILTCVLLCFLGLQAGKILLHYKNYSQRLSRFLIWFMICGLIGGGLCEFNLNEGLIPINKNLWSLSYTLSLASLAFLLLSIFYTTIDHFKIWNGCPFYAPGMNSILLYLGHELLANVFPVQFRVSANHASRLGLHLYGTALWIGVASVLHRNSVYITI